MSQLTVILTLIFSLLAPQSNTVSNKIERAFLQNNAHMLSLLFPSDGHVNLSFPEPISFSDQLTDQQAFFLFQKIFSHYPTFEFYSLSEEREIQNDNTIFKSRWSFKDKKNNNQYVYHVFFLLKKSETTGKNEPDKWKIIEIKAARI